MKIILLSLLFSISVYAKDSKTIDQLQMIDVNGTKQALLMRSENIDKPVILFVHGGPGSPLMLFSRAFDDIYLKDFVVVHWDQRGSGKSYSPQAPIKLYTAEQIANDGLVVTDFLKNKFKRSKITLVGHSWGSIVAALMTQKQPKDFTSFVSVGTVADMSAADKLKFKFLKTVIKSSGSTQDKKDLVQMGPPPWTKFHKLVIQSRLMAKFKGSFYALDPQQINAAVGKNKEYTESELQTLNVSMEKIWNQISPFLNEYKAIKSVPKIEVPVFFVQGLHDMATPTKLAKDYFDQVTAPQGKRWIEISGSAHFPMYEESNQFLTALKEATNL